MQLLSAIIALPPIPDGQPAEVVFHGTASCRVEQRVDARRAYEVMKHCCIKLRERSIAAGTCSWSTNHLQLVSYAQSLMSQIVYGRVLASIL